MMPNVKFILPDSSEQIVEAYSGDSLMKTAVDSGIEQISADCGGCCSCATCHCYIDDTWLDKLTPPDEMEITLMECVSEYKPNSRLSCQITLSLELDGLIVHIPESNW